MTEVSSWSATDASNNLTPPDGWPEGMQPSGVNDVGRMMMGAVRRWYNTVSAGIANALPLSGGTLTGLLTAPYIHSTGNIAADNDVTSLDIHASRNIYGSNLNASAGITASGNITTSNSLVGAYVQSTGNIDAAGGIHAVGNLSTNNSVTAAYVTSSGNIDAAATITAGNLSVTGSANITNAIVANSLNANSLVNTVTYQLNGSSFVTRRTDGAGTCNAIFDGGGGLGIDLYGANGSYYRCDNAHTFTNRAATVNIVRFQVSDGVCQNATGSWSVFSDASVKENLASYTAGLAEVLQLNPQSFSYIPGRTKFATEGRTFYGLVAQEVEPVLPEMVSADDETGIATLAPTHLVYVLINAVKELEARLAQVENRGG